MSALPPLDAYENPDPNEVSCEQYLTLFDADDIDPAGKFEYYADKPRVGGLPLYEFVRRYLALRGEEPRRVT